MIETDPRAAASKKAIDHFMEGVIQFDNEEEATAYAMMMISMGVKLVQGTKGSQFKKHFLEAAIKDPSFLKIAGLTTGPSGKTDTVIA